MADTPPDHGRQSNGEAETGRPEAGQVEMEDWEELDEGEQDPATDYYALLNVPRDVLGPPSFPLPSSRSHE